MEDMSRYCRVDQDDALEFGFQILVATQLRIIRGTFDESQTPPTTGHIPTHMDLGLWKAGLLCAITAFVLSRLLIFHLGAITTMSSSDSDPLDHSELISVLTEIYTLLDTLSATPPSSADLPPSDTGVWPPSDFDFETARAAGFSEEAVRVLSMIPYPAYPQELEPMTTALSFARVGRHVDDWHYHRVLIDG